MKILVMNDLIAGGGTEYVMHVLVNQLHQNNENKITVASLFGQKKEFKEMYPKGIHFTSAYINKLLKYKRFSPGWIIYRMYLMVWEWLLRLQKYDLVLVMKEGPAMVYGQNLKAKKKFCWVQADYSLMYWTENCFESAEHERLCMQKYTNIVCVSKAAMDGIIQVIGDPGNLVVKLNPIDVEKIQDLGEQRVEELEAYLDEQKPHHPILISLGRLAPVKGYERLLRACEKVNEEFDFEVWILGDGELRAELEREIAEKELKNIILWGNQKNPYPFIKRADCFVSTSYGESYGLAVQEALILGVRVLAAKCPAFEECVASDEAILVPNTDEAILEGLSDVLTQLKYSTERFDDVANTRTHQTMFIERIKEIEKLWL